MVIVKHIILIKLTQKSMAILHIWCKRSQEILWTSRTQEWNLETGRVGTWSEQGDLITAPSSSSAPNSLQPQRNHRLTTKEGEADQGQSPEHWDRGGSGTPSTCHGEPGYYSPVTVKGTGGSMKTQKNTKTKQWINKLPLNFISLLNF